MRLPPYAARRQQWTHRTGYAPCQSIAREASLHDITLVRYESVRDLERGCGAVPGATGFARPEPVLHQTWSLHVTRARVSWREDTSFSASTFEFPMGLQAQPLRCCSM